MSPRAATQHSKRKPRAAKVVESRDAKLLLLGNPVRVGRIEKALRDLEIELVRVDDARRSFDTDTVGIVVVPPLATGTATAKALSDIRQSTRGRAVPLFVVIDDDTPDREVRRIYAAGATAVFHWPRESLLLARLVAELLGLALVRGRARRPQAALTRALKAHLRLAPWSTAGVRARALSGGEVQLSGSVPTLWRKRGLERLVAQIPGVKRVASTGLWVEPSGLTDSQIARAVRSVLRNTIAVDEATVSVAVHNGLVTLAGTVADRRELRRILDLMAHVKGVRGVNSTLVVSTAARQKDGTTARRLDALLAKWFPQERIEVSVFAQVAVLSGTVSQLSRRAEIEGFVDQHASIARVINKLDVG